MTIPCDESENENRKDNEVLARQPRNTGGQQNCPGHSRSIKARGQRSHSKTTKESAGDRLIHRIRVKSRHTTKGHRIIQARWNSATKQRKGAVARRRVIEPVVKLDNKEREDSLPKERADKVTVESFSSVKGRS